MGRRQSRTLRGILPLVTIGLRGRDDARGFVVGGLDGRPNFVPSRKRGRQRSNEGVAGSMRARHHDRHCRNPDLGASTISECDPVAASRDENRPELNRERLRCGERLVERRNGSPTQHLGFDGVDDEDVDRIGQDRSENGRAGAAFRMTIAPSSLTLAAAAALIVSNASFWRTRNSAPANRSTATCSGAMCRLRSRYDHRAIIALVVKNGDAHPGLGVIDNHDPRTIYAASVEISQQRAPKSSFPTALIMTAATPWRCGRRRLIAALAAEFRRPAPARAVFRPYGAGRVHRP